MKDVSLPKVSEEISPHLEQLTEHWQAFNLYQGQSTDQGGSRRSSIDGNYDMVEAEDEESVILDKPDDPSHTERFPDPVQDVLDMYRQNRVKDIMVEGMPFFAKALSPYDTKKRPLLEEERYKAVLTDISDMYEDKNLSMYEKISAFVNSKYEEKITNLEQGIRTFEEPYQVWVATGKFSDLATGTKEENEAKADRTREYLKMKKEELKALKSDVTAEINALYKAQTDLQGNAQKTHLDIQKEGHKQLVDVKEGKSKLPKLTLGWRFRSPF